MRVAPSPLDETKITKRTARQAALIEPAEHALRSNLAASAVTRMPHFKTGARVAIYFPFDREINTAALLVAARRRGVRIFVPVVTDLRHRRIASIP
jgi:5-formyltetrahydrofolate cyclo-ligase